MLRKWEVYVMETGELTNNARRYLFKRSAINRAQLLNESMSNRGVAGRTYAARKRNDF